MKWPAGRELDRAFGPRFPNSFDFTLRFEHIILTIVPSLVFMLLALCYLRYYFRQPVYTRNGGLKWVEIGASAILVLVEIASLGLWCTPVFRSGTAIGAAVVSCVATTVLAVVISTEYHRSLQASSVLTGAFLLLSVLIEITKARSYFLRAMSGLAGVSTASIVCRCTLLGLLEVPKRRNIVDDELRKSAGKEAVAGFWSRTFFTWLNPTFVRGFRSVLRVEDLSNLDPVLSSENLSGRFQRNWAKSNKDAKSALLKACLKAFYAEFLYVAPPQLCLSAFTLVQPLYLRRVVQFIGEENPSAFVRTGLILSAVLIFLGLGASRALCQHMNYRGVTTVRGALIPQIFQKTLGLSYSIAKESAAATLMSTDIEGIATGIPHFHKIWASFLQLVIGVYLLTTIINEATFLVVVPILISFVVTYFLGKLFGKNLTKWNGKIQERVALTSKNLLQMKSIKMIGLENVVSEQIKKSRLEEIASFRVMRFIIGAMHLSTALSYSLSPILAIAGGLFWTTFNGRLTAVDAFTTLAMTTIIIQPMVAILHAYPLMKGIAACLNRIQRYLLLDEVQNSNTSDSGSEPDFTEKLNFEEKTSDPVAGGCLAEFTKASVAPTAKADSILRDVTFKVMSSHFTILLGPVGCGKTTLLRAILGEAAVPQGQFWRRKGNFAYCGQKPWLRNLSIRDNITGSQSFEKTWYDEVIRVCCLEYDLQQLPNGDKTLAGNNGANLSGGQKHRVALARAVYSREHILVLDDVLSGLDAEMSQAIYSGLFGNEGLLRKSASTVIFATHSVRFLKVADQALIFDGNGTVSVESNPADVALDDDLIAKIEHRESSMGKAGGDSDGEGVPSAPPKPEIKDDLKSRSRADASLYKYLYKTTRPWQTALFIVTTMITVATERFPEVYIRIWLETHPTDNTYFAGYVSIAGFGFLNMLVMLWVFFLTMLPDNGVRLHTKLLDAVMGANLSFLSSTDTGSIVNRFSQDMTILTQKMPLAVFSVVYMGSYMVYDVIIIISAAQYSALILPAIVAVFYGLQLYYLRTSRQMRYLDIEAKAPLYTVFTDMSNPNGLEHIRAFGWQERLTAEGIQALEFSQKPFYYMYTVQRWLELSMDLIGLSMALILICIATFYRQTTSQAGLGLSMLNLITFGNMMNLFISAWTELETSLGALARLRTFVTTTPQETTGEEPTQTSLPPKWPQSGCVVLDNVSSKYQSTDVSPVVRDVTVKIDSSQKVGIAGQSGSGKSSLLLTLLGFLDYTGTIEIDGINVSHIPKPLLRSRITTISQDAVQLQGSVRENLLPYEGQASDGKVDDTAVLRTLDRVGLSEVISSKGGIDASLSDMSLSEGEMQFLCLARAILHNLWTEGKLVLMDEPTSNMDYETDARIQSLVREAFAGCTIIMVSHRPEAIADVDVHLDVVAGKVTRRVNAEALAESVQEE